MAETAVKLVELLVEAEYKIAERFSPPARAVVMLPEPGLHNHREVIDLLPRDVSGLGHFASLRISSGTRPTSSTPDLRMRATSSFFLSLPTSRPLRFFWRYILKLASRCRLNFLIKPRHSAFVFFWRYSSVAAHSFAISAPRNRATAQRFDVPKPLYSPMCWPSMTIALTASGVGRSRAPSGG